MSPGGAEAAPGASEAAPRASAAAPGAADMAPSRGSGERPPALAVVIVTHRSAAAVPRTLEALEPQLGEGDELVVVDSGSDDGTPAAVRAASARARVLEPGRNVGFAAGCRLGADATRAPLLLFLNPDATAAPGALDALRAAASQRPAWAAWQALVTLPGGERINTAGGVVHFLGVAWAGRCGEPLDAAPAAPVEVGFASGAALVVRRGAWTRAGGFDPRYFMYGEDVDLSLRLRLAGGGVGVVPAARVEHDYAFRKGARKWYLLERNRWWTLLGDYPAPLLALLAPALLLSEPAVLAVALRGGWGRAKLRAQAAVLRELPALLARRRAVQRTRGVSAADFAACLSAELDSPFLGGAARLPGLAAAQAAIWSLVLRALDRPARRRRDAG